MSQRKWKTTNILTKRQQDVLRLTMRGIAAREVGKRLGITRATVHSHLAHAYKILGLHGIKAVIAAAKGIDR